MLAEQLYITKRTETGDTVDLLTDRIAYTVMKEVMGANIWSTFGYSSLIEHDISRFLPSTVFC